MIFAPHVLINLINAVDRTMLDIDEHDIGGS